MTPFLNGKSKNQGIVDQSAWPQFQEDTETNDQTVVNA